jgi:hypothetical protein
LASIAIADLRCANDDRDQVDSPRPVAIMYHDRRTPCGSGSEIELYRPRIRLVRGADGRCNLAGLLSPPDLTQPMPILVIKQGTLLFGDHHSAPGSARWEVQCQPYHRQRSGAAADV